MYNHVDDITLKIFLLSVNYTHHIFNVLNSHFPYLLYRWNCNLLLHKIHFPGDTKIKMNFHEL